MWDPRNIRILFALLFCFGIPKQTIALPDMEKTSLTRSEAASITAGCVSPFVEVGDQCLYFSSNAENQPNSRSYCKSLGGDLAAIYTATQMENIITVINENGITGRPFWIDGSDAEVEGKWQYSSGLAIPLGTPFWAATPGDQQPDGYPDEDCLNLGDDFLYLMNDNPCYASYPPICEQSQLMKSSVGKPLASVECPPWYVDIGGVCMAFILWHNLPWVDARESCRSLGGELASIDDIELLRSIYLYLEEQDIAFHSFWLSGSDLTEEGVWTWIDGKPIPRGQPFWGVKTWFVSEPDGGSKENCLALTASGYHYFRDEDCRLPMNPLCMLSA